MVELALVGALGALTAVLVLTSPRLVLLATIVYVLFAPKIGLIAVPGTSVLIRVEDLLIAVLVARLAIDLILGRWAQLSNAAKAILVAFAALVPVGLLGILAGTHVGAISDFGVGAIFLARRVEYFAMFALALVYLSPTPDSSRAIDRILRIATLFNFAFSVLQVTGIAGGFIRGQAYAPLPDGRAISTFSGAYELGGVTVLFAVYFAWKLIHERKKTAPFVYLAAASTTVFLTQSRSSIVALIVVLLALMLVELKPWRPLLTTAGIILAGAAALASGNLASGRFETISLVDMTNEVVAGWTSRSFESQMAYGTIINIQSEDLSFSYRARRWFNYLDGVARFDPLFGLGPSGGGEVLDGNYVRILIEYGVVGVVLHALLIYLIWRALRRAANRDALWALAAWGGLSLLMQGVFIDIFESSKVAEFYLFSLGAVVGRMGIERIPRSPTVISAHGRRHD